MSLTIPAVAIICGLVLLIWSAERFIEGAAATARYAGMPPLLIGMVVIGFGTSAPEMVVSAISAVEGNPGLALGNAYGSNIANIALILGVTALISPIALKSSILKKELPVLLGVTILSAILLFDLSLSRLDAWILLFTFAVIMGWWIWLGLRQRQDNLADDVEVLLEKHPMSLKAAIIWLIVGVILLVISSRILVWGAVEVARGFGVSDLIIGLTIVAIGTSLPELASALAATRKGEHDLAIGNVIGSNLFNTLAVVGIAGAIRPLEIGPEVLYRDCLLMGVLTIALFMARGKIGGQKHISRIEGFLLLMVYLGYSGYLSAKVLGFVH
jgi:cation:H+ antiporter